MNGDVDHDDESVSIQLNIEELVTLALQLREVPTWEVEFESVPVDRALEPLARPRLESGEGDVAVQVAGDTVTLSGYPTGPQTVRFRVDRARSLSRHRCCGH